mmetsp:Transcript_31531/g.94340  ORF Transcript_31531/g.94340 Transcript_31531/m.94340 type:complete len:300 (+) Transcript_31531:305-1204(+)
MTSCTTRPAARSNARSTSRHGRTLALARSAPPVATDSSPRPKARPADVGGIATVTRSPLGVCRGSRTRDSEVGPAPRPRRFSTRRVPRTRRFAARRRRFPTFGVALLLLLLFPQTRKFLRLRDRSLHHLGEPLNVLGKQGRIGLPHYHLPFRHLLCLGGNALVCRGRLLAKVPLGLVDEFGCVRLGGKVFANVRRSGVSALLDLVLVYFYRAIALADCASYCIGSIVADFPFISRSLRAIAAVGCVSSDCVAGSGGADFLYILRFFRDVISVGLVRFCTRGRRAGLLLFACGRKLRRIT